MHNIDVERDKKQEDLLIFQFITSIIGNKLQRKLIRETDWQQTSEKTNP